MVANSSSRCLGEHEQRVRPIASGPSQSVESSFDRTSPGRGAWIPVSFNRRRGGVATLSGGRAPHGGIGVVSARSFDRLYVLAPSPDDHILMYSRTAVFTELVRDHMDPAPLCVPDRTPCAELVRSIRELAASSALITDSAGAVVGIVTEQDICRRVVFEGKGDAPVSRVMTSPVRAVKADDFLFHAIAHMRGSGLRHMPVVDSEGKAVGLLHLHRALAVAAGSLVDQIEALTHAETLEGMRKTKGAQVELAAQLFQESVPAPEIQSLLTRINNDLYRRVVDLCLREMEVDGWGEPPLPFDVIVMGSGGRGESYLTPDQDNGFILSDYPDEEHQRIDSWFIKLGERMTEALDAVGFSYCRGHVMATNPLWRKSLSQWRSQVGRWVARSEGLVLRLADIFFDFAPVHGEGKLTSELRRFVTRAAPRPFFLREMYRVDEEHGVALGLFGRLKSDPLRDEGRAGINLKLTGTLPLVEAIRLFALREQIPETSTMDRIRGLHEKGVLADNEQDYLRGSLRHITKILLRQQLADYQAGKPVGNHVPRQSLSQRERDMLVDSFKAIRAFRSRVRAELSGELF